VSNPAALTGKAVVVPVPGGLEALQLADVPVPLPGAREVLIEVHAAGINRADVKQRAGDYPMPPGASNVPGLEVSGRIVAVGQNVERWAVGQDVCALVISGGYAEYCIAPADQCLAVPPGVSLLESAALPEAAFTVWTALFEAAGLRAGESVLIHGGASGIGTMAIQMASALGSRALVTAGSNERCAACANLGAELAINYREEDFVEAVLRHTDGRGVDVVLDMIGGPYSERNTRVLAPHGRLCFIAGDGGQDATFKVRDIMLKRLTITGSTLRHRSIEDKGRVAGILERIVWPLFAQGRIRPLVNRQFSLDRVQEAHAAMEAGNVTGKIILRVR
jgi:putative PIG3 family NAD(P)H quinone oxidoreductase